MTHGRPVFVSPPDKRAEAAAAHAQITANSTAAKSDHLAIIAAFNGWTAAWTKGGRQQAHTVCCLFICTVADAMLLSCTAYGTERCVNQHRHKDPL